MSPLNRPDRSEELIDVSEIFLSIQGESSFAGRLCVFIRVIGCNLDCAWCDTRYAAKGAPNPIPIESILRRSREIAGGVELIELTGGEPLAALNIGALIARLLADRRTVLIETNGSIDLRRFSREPTYIVDYKLPSSGEEGSFLESNWAALKPTDEIKFVIADETDFERAKNLIVEKAPIARTINFAPAWGRIDPRRLAELIIESRLNVRVNLPLHKYLYGADAIGR